MDFCEYMFPYRNPFLFFHIFSKSIFRWTKNNRFRFGYGGSNRRIWYPIIGLFSSSGWVVLSLSDPCEGGAGILVSHSTVVGQSSMALAGNIIWAITTGKPEITTGKPENPQNVFFLWNPPNTLLKVFGTILICPEYSTVCWGYGFSSWLFLVLEMIDLCFMFEHVPTGSWNSRCQKSFGATQCHIYLCVNVWCCICIYEGSSNSPSFCVSLQNHPTLRMRQWARMIPA